LALAESVAGALVAAGAVLAAAVVDVDVSIFAVAAPATGALLLTPAPLLTPAFPAALLLVDALFVVALLSLRQSVSAVPSIPLHGAGIADGDAVAVVDEADVLSDALPVVCALTTPAAANAVASSRVRGLNKDFS